MCCLWHADEISPHGHYKLKLQVMLDGSVLKRKSPFSYRKGLTVTANEGVAVRMRVWKCSSLVYMDFECV